MNTATKVAEELDILGLNEQPEEEPPVEPEIPPEAKDEPTGVEDPSDEPDTTDREHTAKAAQGLARAVDQLGVAFEQLMGEFRQVQEATKLFVEVLERQEPPLAEMMDADGEEDGPADMVSYDPEIEIGDGPTMIEGEDDSEGEDDGDDAEVSQGE